MDGIDVAMVETDGEDFIAQGPACGIAYDNSQRELLRRAQNDASLLKERDARPGALGEAERELTYWHVDAVHKWSQKTGVSISSINVISFHGQTVLHRPEQRLTVQLGDGAAMARRLGIPVVYDMRAADVAAGGQGAPLVPVYHRALANSLAGKPVAFVNIGGVANVTWVGEDGALMAFDTGPGNALLDDWMKRHTGKAIDEGGQVAMSGRVDEGAVAQFLGDSYFERPAPKSLDRNDFAGFSIEGLGLADGAATLAAVTARTIALSSKLMPAEPCSWVICGGGRHNKAIMAALSKLLPRVVTAEEVGFNGDSMEAEAWAYLAVRSLKGLPLSFPDTTGVARPMPGGVFVKPR